MRNHTAPYTHTFFIIGIFFFLTILTFVSYMITLTDYGPTWDEFFHAPNGKRYLEFIKTGNLFDIFSNPNSAWFPPVATTIGYAFVDNAYVTKIYPHDSDRFHIGAVLFASITVGLIFIIVYTLSRNIYISLFASLLLAVHPQFVTHAHTNVRDMGLMMFYTATILSLLKSMDGKGSTVWVAISGLLTGITTDAKQNGALLVPIAILWFFLHIRSLGIKRFVFGILFFLSVFLITFFIFWPYLWADTFTHLNEVWKFLTTPSIIAGNFTFYDHIYTSMKDIPMYYPWVILFLLTPPIVGFLALLGLVVSGVKVIKDKRIALILLWIFIPLSRFLFPKSSISYDQIRHFLEVLPAVAIFASLSIWYVYQMLKNKRKYRWIVVGLALIAILYTRYISLIYEPFGTAYFNIFAGTPAYVNHAFDVEFWGNVYRKAVEHLNMEHGKYVVYYTPGLGSHLLRENGLQGKLTEDFFSPIDYVIFMNKQNWIRDRHYILWLIKNKKPVFTIEREGKILFYQFKPYKEEYFQALSKHQI